MRRGEVLVWLTVVIFSFLAAGSCSNGESRQAPFAPSPSSSSATRAVSGATIQGTVHRTTGVTAAATSPGWNATAPSSLTVLVVGTSVEAPVDASGHFTLVNVPPGNAQLHFTAADVDAYLELGPLDEGQTLTIVVTVSANSAVLESESSSGSSSDDNAADDESEDSESTDDDPSDDESEDGESTGDEPSDDHSEDGESEDDESEDSQSADDESDDDPPSDPGPST